jgi:two-component system, cell cycle sensor histidine kinase and response regulator CckA
VEEHRTDRATPAHDPLLVGAQRMDVLGRLAPGIAHELANPFAAILAFGSLVGTDPRLPEDVREDAGAMRREAELGHARTRALLDFVRQRAPERHPTRVLPLVQATLDLVSYALTSQAVRVETSIRDDLPPIPVDRGLVQQAVLNLLLNALDALEAQGGGIVTIRARGGDGGDGDGRQPVRVEVEDDGPGVEPELTQRMFDPGVTTRPGRAGLGLTVVRVVAAEHGGTVAHRVGPGGRGAVFVLELPLAPAGDQRAAPPGDAQRPDADADDAAAPRPLVLVVDDEHPLRRFLSRALDGIGVDVVEAASGRDAIDAVGSATGNGSRTIDLVLSDLRMPGVDGMQVYESIVAVRPELAERFVLMSGDVHDPGLRGFAQARGIRLVSKPFDLAEIRATVRSMLDEG